MEEALDSGSNEVRVQKNTNVSSDLTIPEGMQVTVDENVTLTLGDTGSLQVDGGLTNRGKISGNADSQSPQIKGDITNEESGTLENCNVEGELTNAGTAENMTVTGDVNNTGTITRSEITGDVTNDGTLSNTNIKGDVDNNGTIRLSEVEGNVTNEPEASIEGSRLTGNVDNKGSISGGSILTPEDASTEVTNSGSITGTAIRSGKVTNDGSISGGSISAPEDDDEPAIVTNGQNGVISAAQITGDVTNNGQITDGSTISGSTENNGIIKESTLEGDVTNNGTLQDNVMEEADVDNTNGTVKGGNNEAITYDVTFRTGAYGTAPDVQAVEYGKKASCPKDPVDADYAFMGWYTDDELTEEFDFALPIKKATDIYAKWISKSETEAYWSINDEIKYGSFADALASASQEIHITKDLELTEDITISEQVTVTVESGVTVSIDKNTQVTLENNAELINSGKINNNGTIAGEGIVTNQKTLTGGLVDTQVINNGTINSAELNGDVTNNKFINDSELNGYVTNNNVINDSEFNGGLNNDNGTVRTDGDDVVFVDTQVQGCVTKENGSEAEIQPGASVKLVQGNRVIAETTADANGKYTLGEIPTGIYNMVIESAGTVNTMLAQVGTDTIQVSDVTLPDGDMNNTIVLDENTPDMIIGGLDALLSDDSTASEDTAGITQSDREVVEAGGSVEIRFEAKPLAEIPADEDILKQAMKDDHKQPAMNLDMTIAKTVTAAEGGSLTTNLTQLGTPLTIRIPIEEELQGKENYVVYRYHNGAVDRITEQTGEEYIVVSENGTVITLYASKFSTYVLAYEMEGGNDPTVSGNDPTVSGNDPTVSGNDPQDPDPSNPGGGQNPDPGNPGGGQNPDPGNPGGNQKPDSGNNGNGQKPNSGNNGNGQEKPSKDPATDEKEDPTAGLSSEQKKEVASYVSKLGLSEEEAVELFRFAQKNGISADTLLVTDQSILARKNDNDIKGSTFATLRARATGLKTKSVTVKWNKVSGADGYIIYGNKCGKGNKFKVIKTIKGGSKTSYTQKKLKAGTYYKYIVRAYKIVGGKKITIAASKVVHATTTGGKYGVAKSVKLNKTTVTLKKGRKFAIKAKEVKADKTIKRHRAVCYESSNPSIATVSSKGVVKGVKKGTCYIYAYAQNGVYKRIKVTVK